MSPGHDLPQPGAASERRAIMIAAYLAAAPAGRPAPGPRRARRSRVAVPFTSRPVAAPDADRGAARCAALHPDYRHIDAWISSVGAGVAVGDFDATASTTKILCLVDPRSDHPVILPVPGTGDRYAPIALIAPPGLASAPRRPAPMGCLLTISTRMRNRRRGLLLGPRAGGVLAPRGRDGRVRTAPPARWFSNAGSWATSTRRPPRSW